MGNVLSHSAVSAGRSTLQLAVAVQQADRDSVQLGLTGIGQGVVAAQTVFDAPLKIAHFFIAEGIVQRQHGNFVGDLTETVQRLGADPLGGRLRRYQFRMLRLDIAQLTHQTIVFRIGNRRFIERVVTVIVIVDAVA